MYFSAKKQMDWLVNDKKYAKTKLLKEYENIVFAHSTPIFRELDGVSDSLQANKKKNLEIATSLLNKICIYPGEKFSFWKIVGKPTEERGFKDGLILKNGELEKGIGGGMCQLTNMIYWLSIHSDLHVVERWRHGYDCFPDKNRTQPFGSGATCGYPNIDLVLENNSANVYQLCFRIENGMLIGELRSRIEPEFEYEIFEKDHVYTREQSGEFTRHNKIFRNRINALTKRIIDQELVSENHAFVMYKIQ